MFKARYYKVDGTKGKARALPEALFDGVVNEAVLHQVVKAHQNNQRQGTGSAKNRAAVRGGSRKPWRQKGTGRARQGSIRAVQWAGGGRAFPPIPHSWRERVPRKVKALARRSAYSARAREDRVLLVDPLELEAPKTRRVRELLEALDLADSKVLFLTHGLKKTVYLSARNLPRVLVRPFGEEATYDILWADVVVVEREAMDAFAADAPETAASSGDEPAPEVEVEEAGEVAAAEAEDAEEPSDDPEAEEKSGE